VRPGGIALSGRFAFGCTTDGTLNTTYSALCH
jgi:hypothetical protein